MFIISKRLKTAFKLFIILCLSSPFNSFSDVSKAFPDMTNVFSNIDFYNESKETKDEISGKTCLVYNEETVDINFKKMKQKLITEIKKDNKL